MRQLTFLGMGIIFGVVMTKSEVISWYRIQEMFRFDSFHMYGVIGSALATGILLLFISKKLNLKDVNGDPIDQPDKQKSFWRYILGGTVFGLGWALTGACPGPIFTLIGNGYLSLIIVLVAAILGTYLYGVLRSKLPH